MATSGPATPAPVPMPAVIDVQPMLRALTDALNRHDRRAFLSQFTPRAVAVAARWWDNMDVIGFDAGSVATYQDQGLQVAPNDAGTADLDYLMAGTHHPSDGTDANGTPVIGTSQYQVQVHWQPGGTVRIDSWRAVRPAPWDCTCKLVATKGSKVVVLSTADSVDYARQVAPAADSAIDFQRRLFAGAKVGLTPLSGVVIFATDKASEIQKWFRASTDKLTDVTGIALAYVRDLNIAFGADRPADRQVGSSRLAVGPMGSGLLPSVLVHELTHYRFFALPLDRDYLTDTPALAEGVAQYLTELYFGSSAQQVAAGKPVADLGTYQVVMTPQRLKKLFTGAPPTASQMRDGTADELNFWYVIAASVFVYLGEKHGVAVALKAAECGYTGRDTFGCAADTLGGSAKSVQTGWAAWVRKQYG